MVRKTNRLSVKGVVAEKTPGYYLDGDGLYLQVSASGSKSWVFCYMLNRKGREMGLGSLEDFSLAEARSKAGEYRQLLNQKIDPIEHRNAKQAQKALDAAKAVSFKECAGKYIKSHKAGWKNPKHASQWENTLETYCYPIFGTVAVQSVDTGLVLKALEPIWNTKPETASRVRGRIERVLDWAKARGFRSGDNPARWRGHLDNLLPRKKKRRRVRHHPALPFDQMPEFMAKLRAEKGAAARALELTILTATRTSEVIAAQWGELDLEAGTWTIPAGHIKGEREHRIPLPPQAAKLLRGLPKIAGQDFVLPGQRAGKPLSNMAMLTLLQSRMGYEDITVHGFRSTFRDWAAERTNFPREVCEMALAHVIRDETEAAYRRGDLFEKRRRLMLEWAKFCERPTSAGKVLPLARKKAESGKQRHGTD